MNSINLTIHNKGFLIEKVLDGIFKNSVLPFELIIVLDGCEDDTETKVVEYLANNHCKVIRGFNILYANNVFETKANNMAFLASTGDFCIVVQDDCVIKEFAWDERLLRPFKEFHDVFAVSGNCAHNWEINPNSKDIANLHFSGFQKLLTPAKDWCDILNHIHHAKANNTPRDIFAVRDTVNRGPLAIKRQDLAEMGYLDEAFAPQDSDDHDLMYRMQKKLGKVCGFYGIEFESLPAWGGTRNPDGSTKQWMFSANHKNTRLLYERHREIMGRQRIENRILR